MDYQRLAIRTATNELLPTAREYVARGWSVIPLRGKVSAVPWKKFQQQPPTLDDLNSWFANRATAATGIGIITGKASGLVVVDCDSPEAATHWSEQYPSTPLVAKTGSGGFHFYYALPTQVEIRNRVNLFGRRIDIRGEGGYVAAPPSLHPSGRRYEWDRKAVGETLCEFLPEWTVENLSAVRFSTHSQTNHIRQAAAYIQRIQAISGQGGHNATFRAACKLRDAGLSADEALEILQRWNEHNAVPPWSSAELRHKIHSAFHR